MPINRFGRSIKGPHGLGRIFRRNFVLRHLPRSTRRAAQATLKKYRSGGGINRKEMRQAYGQWRRNTKDRISRSQAKTIRRELEEYRAKQATDPRHPRSSPAYFRTGHDQLDHLHNPDQTSLPSSPGPLPQSTNDNSSPSPSPSSPPSPPSLPGSPPDLSDATLPANDANEPLDDYDDPDMSPPPSPGAPPPSFDNSEPSKDIFGRPRL